MFRHILLATDGSSASGPAAKLAVTLAREQSARLTAVYVVDPYPYMGLGETNPMGLNAYLSAARDHAAAAHSEVEAMCREGGTPVVSDAAVVCLRPGGVPNGFVPAVPTAKRGRG